MERGEAGSDGQRQVENGKERQQEEEKEGVVVLRLEVSDEDPSFDLEKAVCSHGLFMMAPNHWDSVTKTFQRPLRLTSQSSFTVRISHPQPRPSLLLISVFGTNSLSPHHQEVIMGQVKRMLRISEQEHKAIREFHKIHPHAKESGFGRIFRSPTLFEDMVKCILLCNCQWSRTLSMARALCELQLELKSCVNVKDFHPKTPQPKELKRKRSLKERVVTRLENKFLEDEIEIPAGKHGNTIKLPVKEEQCSAAVPAIRDSQHLINSSELPDVHAEHRLSPANQLTERPISQQIGDFPSPEELAVLNEDLLTKHCGLGYRAKRILSLAQNIVENKLQLEELEKLCISPTPSTYDKLSKQLLAIDGFGPFTCANVLMCMGFYNKIPSDTETVRHIKQFHVRRCTAQNVQMSLEDIYGNYAPFQFLAYWSELWGFYEKRFGKLSEMPISDYQLITASNMKTKVYSN